MTSNPSQRGDAQERLVSELVDAQNADGARRSSALALHAVLRFLQTIPEIEVRCLEAPIFALLLALDDLNKGITTPMLKPSGSFANRHPDNTARKIMKAYCSYAVDLLHNKGFDIECSCRPVAGALTGSMVLKGHSEKTWTKIKTWRDGVSKLHMTDQERTILEGLRSEESPVENMSPEAARAHVVGLIQRLEKKVGRYAALE